MGKAIIRLGHEANGDWYFDSVGNAEAEYAQWRSFWARATRIMDAVPGAAFEFDWTVNAGYRPVPFEKYYPGDDVVDIIGIDQYDSVNPDVGVKQPLRWEALRDQPYGLGALLRFARERGKPVSIPEWGLLDSSVDPMGANDDWYFADRIAQVVRENHVRYHSYFNAENSGTIRLQDLPGSRASWKRHFGATGDSLAGSGPAAPTPTPTPTPGQQDQGGQGGQGGTVTAGDSKTPCVSAQNSLQKLKEFGWLVGKQLDCAVVHNDAATSWADWEDPWMIHMPVAAYPEYQWPQWVRDGRGARTLVLTQSLAPKGLPADWRARGAAGEYDERARALARNLVARGLGSTVVRLGAKANGDWAFDNIGATDADFANWKAYWARVVKAMRSVPGADFTFDWTVNGNWRPIAFDKYYPGDDVVDVIGIAQYDFAPAAVGRAQPARFTYQLGLAGGLGQLLAFAEAHGKPLSISEWAVTDGARSDGSGDDWAFADQLAKIVRERVVAYHAYVESTANGALPLSGVSGTRASWKRHFGVGGDSLGR
nr:glycosyl hydrolase [Motilibacter aurantiacus]